MSFCILLTFILSPLLGQILNNAKSKALMNSTHFSFRHMTSRKKGKISWRRLIRSKVHTHFSLISINRRKSCFACSCSRFQHSGTKSVHKNISEQLHEVVAKKWVSLL